LFFSVSLFCLSDKPQGKIMSVSCSLAISTNYLTACGHLTVKWYCTNVGLCQIYVQHMVLNWKSFRRSVCDSTWWVRTFPLIPLSDIASAAALGLFCGLFSQISYCSYSATLLTVT